MSGKLSPETRVFLAGRTREYTNYSFRHRQDIPALQCVDAIGWVCYRQALLLYRGTPLHPLAKEAWTHFGANSGPHSWLQVLTISREHLKEGIETEMKDGRTLKRFEEWRTSRTISA